MRYVQTNFDLKRSNSPYSITLLLATSMLFSPNLWANPSFTLAKQVSVPSVGQPLQKITIKDALFKSMVAEFNIHQGYVQAGIDEYLPLALHTNSIESKRRALNLSLESNDIDSAYAIANTWVKQEPHDVPALFYLAHTALKAHRYQTFVQTLDRILTIDENANLDQILTGIMPEDPQDRELLLATLNSIQQKNNPSLLVLMATLEAKNGEYELSLYHINKALRVRPNTSSFILLKANLLLAMDKKKDALKFLKKSNNRYKKNTDVRLAEVQLLVEQKQEKKALKRLTNALKYNPNAEDLLFLAGLTHIDHKQYQEAEKHLTQLKKSPRYQHDANYYLAINAERQGQLETALMYYRQVDGTLYTISRQEMIKTYQKLKQHDEALRFLTQERVNYPNYSSFLYQLQAELLRNMGEHQEALEILKSASADLPDDPDLMYLQIELLDPHKDQKYLDELLTSLLAIEPNSPSYLNAFAYTLALQNRQLDKARKYAEQALALAPNQASILDTLGYIAFLQNDYQTAVDKLAQAYQHNPSISIAVKYAKALYMLGDLSHFKDLVTQLKQKYPQDEQVLQLDMLILPDHLSPTAHSAS